MIIQGIPKIITDMKSTLAMLCFGCSSHTNTYNILSEKLVSQILQAYSPIPDRAVLRYIKNVKSRPRIGLPKNRGLKHCVVKQVLMLEMCFSILFCTTSESQHIVSLVSLGFLSFHLFAYFGRRYNKDNKL